MIRGRLYVFAVAPAVAGNTRAEGRIEGRSWGCLVVMYESSLGLIPLSLRAAI